MTANNQSWIDRPTARWVAFSVFVAMLILLGVIHRDYLCTQPKNRTSAANTDYVLCLNERGSTIDQMIDEGVIDEKQATLFKTRADALCRTKFPP